MTKKPEANATLPHDETIIGNGMDHKTLVSWPQTSANIAADDSTLPVPDPSAFEPDTLPSKDTADVQWPAEPDLKAPTVSQHAQSEKSRQHIATESGRAVRGTHPRNIYMYVAPHRKSYAHKITHATNSGH